TLLPVPRRRVIWRQLQAQGLPMPALELPGRMGPLCAGGVLLAAVTFALCVQSGWGLLLAFPLGLIVYGLNRPFAVHFPLGLRTVGELVIYLISFREHKDSGYRWTGKEIEIKVRLIIAENLGVPLGTVQRETTWDELGMG